MPPDVESLEAARAISVASPNSFARKN